MVKSFVRMVVIVFVAGMAAMAGSLVPAYSAGLENMIELSVSGDPGQFFAGDCYLMPQLGKEKRHRIKGRVPTKLWLPARAIRCHLEKSSAKGKLVLTVKRSGAEDFVQRSRYPLRWIFVASRGPWGNARGGTSASRPIVKK